METELNITSIGKDIAIRHVERYVEQFEPKIINDSELDERIKVVVIAETTRIKNYLKWLAKQD